MFYIRSNGRDVLEFHKPLSIPLKDVRTTPIVNSHSKIRVLANFKWLNIERLHCGQRLEWSK